jgi:hypothetical protein
LGAGGIKNDGGDEFNYDILIVIWISVNATMYLQHN